ncbi:MAG: glycosyltransferase [Chitinivibrionales bacterium]|nr:glycosyltransferase [Chitinivibrionales bacterium]MBD3356503.1 glycosyltransferase [Chitinivibrionales bacterium]
MEHGTALSKHTWPSNVFVLIPAYNSAQLLADYLPDLLETVLAAHVCVVDDGSADETTVVCREHEVCCLVNTTNMGKGAALKRGFEFLRNRGAEWILTMDADGQHSIQDIPGFIATMKLYPDAGLIIGARRMHWSSMPVARIISNRLTSLILSLFTGCRIYDSQSGYRLYSRRLLDSVSLEYSRFEMESEIILKACRSGFDIRFVSVQTLYFHTHSHISHIIDTVRWIKAVLNIRRKLKRASSMERVGGGGLEGGAVHGIDGAQVDRCPTSGFDGKRERTRF